MTLRYLFGPVTTKFADQYLQTQRRQGNCLAFHTSEPVDVKIAYGDTWDEVIAKLPPDWRPDFLVLYLPYTAIPPALLRCAHPHNRLGPRLEPPLAYATASHFPIAIGFSRIFPASRCCSDLALRMQVRPTCSA